MDRLSALIALAAFVLGACSSEERAAAPAPSRVVAVAADPSARRKPDDFCDAMPRDRSTRFTLPPLAGGALPSEGKPRWINVWATWCRPCVEEMPLLRRWNEQLAREGLGYALQFLSVDAEDEAIASFRATHPDTPESARLASTEALPAFLASLGLDENAPIPIHVFLDGKDGIRCVRAGAIGEKDLEVVREVLRLR